MVGTFFFDQIPERMKALDERVAEGLGRVTKVAATAIGVKVVDMTRVDTGKARSNWRATLGFPAQGTIPPYSPGNHLGINERANASAAKIQHRAVISKFTTDPQGDSRIFITNNVHYIGILNGRDSIVPAAVQAGRVAIRGTTLLRGK